MNNLFKIIIFLFTSSFLLCCSQRESYKLTISDKFSDRQIELIIAAVEQWELHCGIYAQVFVGHVSDYDLGAIYPAKSISQKDGMHIPFINKIPIFLSNISSEEGFYFIILHELGHWIGGLHTDDRNDVMYGGPIDRGSTIISHNDIESVCPWSK